MKPVVQLSGKAKQVFKFIALLSRYKGSVTLKELAKDDKPFKLDLKS